MPQPKLQKQRKAIALYQQAIDGWWMSLRTEMNPEKIAKIEGKIKRLEAHVRQTQIAMQRIPGGNRIGSHVPGGLL